MRKLSAIFLGVMVCALTAAAQQTEQIPFRVARGHLLLVKGSLAGVENLTVLLDTGIHHSVIDEGFARRLPGRRREALILTSAREVRSSTLEVSEISVGPLRAASLKVFTADLGGVSKIAGEPVHALIGLDLLRRKSFTLDLKKRRIFFGPPPTAGNTLELDPLTKALVVEVQIDGRAARMSVDTGCNAVALFAGAMPQPAEAADRSAADSLGGGLELTRAKVRQFRLGGGCETRLCSWWRAPGRSPGCMTACWDPRRWARAASTSTSSACN